MSRHTEKIFREFHKFIEGKDLSEDELGAALDEFMKMKNSFEVDDIEEDAWYYLDLAYEANTKKDAVKYAKKALKIDKACLDAEALVADLTIDNPEKLKRKYESLINKAEKILKEDKLFEEDNIGYFWGILETRPYMRLRASYLKLIISMGKFKKAIGQCQELLELSTNDNLGIRYMLINLYAYFEDEINVLKIYKKHKEDSTSMLMPLVIMYYKMDNLKEAEKYLKKLNKVNEDLSEFIDNLADLDESQMEDIVNQGSYRPDSMDEILINLTDNGYLYGSSGTFLFWLTETLFKINK